MPNLQSQTDRGLQSDRRSDEPSRFEFRVVTIAPDDKQRALDHALEETFPASDPVSITITEVVRVRPDRSGVH